MKKLLLLIMLLPFAALAQPKVTTITFDFDDDARELVESEGKPRLKIPGHDLIDAQQDIKGNWIIVLPELAPNYGALATFRGRGTRDIFITPGANIVAKPEANGGISYKGTNAAINTYLNGVRLSGISSEDFKLSADEYVAKLRKQCDRYQEQLKQGKFGKEFTNLESQRIELLYVQNLISYSNIYAKVMNKPDYAPTQEFVDVVDKAFVENEKMFILDDYKNAAASLVGILWKTPADAKTREDATLDKMNFIVNKFKGDQIRQYLIHNAMYVHVKETGTKYTTRIDPFYRTYVKNPNYIKGYEAQREQMTSDLDKMKKKASGEKVKCPSFVFKDIKGKEVKLEDFAGKYIYIDCWATWCGPCKKEIPSLMELEKKFHGQNIAFVSVSSDKDLKAWKDMVKLDGLTGIQLHIGDEKEFHKAMQVRTIPRFMLVDPQGYFVSDNMTRPSNSQTEEFINSLKGIK